MLNVNQFPFYHMDVLSSSDIARHDKKQDLDIIIPTFVVSRKLMDRYKALTLF